MGYFIDSFYAALKLIVTFDPEIYFVVWTSLKVSVLAAFCAAVVGVPAGIVIALNDFRGKQGVLLILNTLMALPTVVVGLIFYGLISRRGVLGDCDLLFSPAGISLGLFALAVPIVVNLTIAAIQGLDSRLFLTCRSLGATHGQQAWMILKEARFAVTAGVVMAFGRVVSEVGIAMMLGGNIRGYTRTMTTAIALETSKGEFELGLALGLVLLTVAFAVNGALFVLQRRSA